MLDEIRNNETYIYKIVENILIFNLKFIFYMLIEFNDRCYWCIKGWLNYLFFLDAKLKMVITKFEFVDYFMKLRGIDSFLQ